MDQPEQEKWHPPRITRVAIEGFKSYGSPTQELEFGPLNVFVGANASGKTNFLSALRFLKMAVTQNADHAVEQMGGLDEVINKRLSPHQSPGEFTLRIEFDCGGMVVYGLRGETAELGRFQYLVRIGGNGSESRASVMEEELDGEMVARRSHRIEHYKLRRDRQHLTVTDPVFSPEQIQEFPVQEQVASRLALGIGFFSAPCVMLRNSIERWQFYNLNPNIARLAYRETAEASLGPNGENLSVVLHQFSEKNGALNEVVSGLRGVVAGFQDVKTDRLDFERRRGFRIIEEGIPDGVSPEAASDGTIRLLGLMTIANQTDLDPPLVGLEEPENGLHPWLVEQLVDVLRNASEERQFFITTHSSSILDWLEPQELFLCDKEDGFTRIHRASNIEQIEVFRKHFSLGELWTQGALGGAL